MTEPVWTLRVTSPTRQTARVSTRQQQFDVMRPLNFDIAQPGISALEYALGALGGEIVTGVRELAWRRRLDVEQVEAVVTGELGNPLAYLEVEGEEGDASLSKIHLKVYVSSREEDDTVRSLFHEATMLLPLICTFRRLVQLELQVVCAS